MVASAFPAVARSFSVEDLLKSNKHVYNVRRAPEAVVQQLKTQCGCSNANADLPLKEKSLYQVRKDLRRRLAESLASGRREVAFAKQFSFDDGRRAERMVFSYPTFEAIDWDAPPIDSDINCDM